MKRGKGTAVAQTVRVYVILNRCDRIQRVVGVVVLCQSDQGGVCRSESTKAGGGEQRRGEEMRSVVRDGCGDGGGGCVARAS